jgi:S-DNA-T family DNA segregation ATPase FtsK/SpoIIIE
MTAGAAGAIAMPVGALPTTVTALRLRPCHQPGRATVLPVGIAHRQLDEVALTVPRGDHVTVLGPPGSGRTTTLHHLVDQWSMARPDSLVLCVGHDSELPTRAQLDPGRPLALVVDDAHLVEDAGGELAALFADRSLDLTCFVAARPDLLRGQFGHWTTTVRRSGLGVVLGPAGDLDGDLLACPLPRSWPLAPRPGLGWLVQAGRAQLVQVASSEASGEHITAAGG